MPTVDDGYTMGPTVGGRFLATDALLQERTSFARTNGNEISTDERASNKFLGNQIAKQNINCLS